MREPFRKAALFVTILLILEIFTGIIIIVVTVYYQITLATYLAEMERNMLANSLISIYIYGAQLFIVFLCSITMWKRIWPRRCTPNVQMLLLMWLFFCMLIICCGFLIVWSLFRGSCVLVSSAETSLKKGIDLYYSSPEWKLLWDGLQLHKQCCGVNNYLDWMKASWLPTPDDDCAISPDAVLAPHTCCKRTCTTCFEPKMFAPSQGGTRGANVAATVSPFPKLSLDNINTDGCLPVFVESMWKFFYMLLILVLMSLKFAILLCCLTKYIMNKQNQCDSGFTDDEGRPLVVVKYPSNVRCITLGEDDLASDIAPCETNLCNCGETDDQCICNDYCE